MGSNTYGKYLKAEREARQLKAWYVAAKLGVSPATYSQIETGKRVLPAERMDKVLDVIGVSREDFYKRMKGGLL